MRKHLHVLDLCDEGVPPGDRGDWHAGDPAWSPDGGDARLRAPPTAPDADLRFRAPVYMLDVDPSRGAAALVGLADGVAGPVAWTADGAALLVVGFAGAPVGHAGLLRVPLDGGRAGRPGRRRSTAT